jgi:hypothetical protein
MGIDVVGEAILFRMLSFGCDGYTHSKDHMGLILEEVL